MSEIDQGMYDAVQAENKELRKLVDELKKRVDELTAKLVDTELKLGDSAEINEFLTRENQVLRAQMEVVRMMCGRNE